MRWGKRLLIGTASVLVVLAAVPGILLGTDTGLQIIKGTLEKTVPGLKIESLSGSAFSLKADNLQYTAPGLTFRGNVSWSLNASKLLSRRVDLNAFELSEATLRIRTQEMASSASTPVPKSPTQKLDKTQTSRFKTPIAVIVKRVAIKNLQADIDGNLVNVGLLQTQAVWTQSRIDIDSVLLRDSRFQSAETPPSDESIGSALKRTFSEVIVPTIPAIELPLDLNLKRFELSNFTIKGNPDQTVDSVTFALTAQNGAVALENIAARAMGAELAGAVTLGLDARHEMTLDLNLSALVAREAIPTGVLPTIAEPTTEEIENFYERLKDVRAERLKAAQERRAKRRAQGIEPRKQVDAKTLTREEKRELRRKAQARLKRRIERWRDSVRGLLPKPEPQPPVTINLTLSGQGSLNDTLSLSGRIENVPGVQGASFVLTASPTKLGLPLSAEIRADKVEISGAIVNAVDVNLSGKAVDYALNATAKALYPVDEKHSLTADIVIRGKGSEVASHLTDFSILSNVGRVQIDGQANWEKNVRFAAALNLSGLNTKEVLPQTPLTVDGSFVIWGERQNGRWKAKLQDLTVLGELRGQSLALTGTVESHGNGIVEAPELYFAVGNNTFEFSGKADFAKDIPELDFKTKIDAPDFGLVDPNLLGSVKGTLAVTGTTRLPVINADLTARNIDYFGTTLKRGHLTGRMRSRDVVSGRLTLQLTDFKTQGVDIRKATIELRGNELRHNLTVHTEGTPISVDAKISGIYERMLGNWAGALAELKVKTAYGPVTLEKPMRLAYVPDLNRANVSKACLAHTHARLCLENDLKIDLTNRSDLRILIGLPKFDLAFIKQYFPGRFVADGIIKANADLTLPAGLSELPRGRVTVRAQDISTKYRMDLSDLKVGFNSVHLSFANAKDSIEGNWKIDIKDNGDIEGSLRMSDLFNTRTVDGTLKFVAVDATLVNSFLSPGESAEGQWFGNLRFAGTLEEPLIYGRTGLFNAKLDSTKLPFEMLPSDIKLTFNGNSSTLEGHLKTPQGEVALNGSADWRTIGEGKAIVTTKGSNLRVTLPPDIEFDLTTDVTCEASSDLIKLDGAISIPWAKVSVSKLPASAVDVSDDVVRLDRPRAKKKAAGKPIPIESNLRIHIGDDVRVEAMGLKARLTGNLNVIQDNGTLGLTGQISVPTGSFKAYGQDLLVRRGEFHFVGAVTNPLLDLEAIRNPDRTADDVIAGIRVTGSVDSPQVAVFTDPAKSETEALSYLIRGEGLDPSGDSDNTMITSALINLGLSQGSHVFESLGDAVGISGLGFETEGVGDSSQLVVSGYVLPGLKVKYGVGIFDSLATLTLRYRVIPRLYVEAVSGVDQALDLLYSFEF
ncbi:MAG TPA: translocation/assembly module TamB [Candidatus Duodenibacillus intestinavium]|nr:translocation/assembly module TamB [Candidatus Duodenibacillus intestinavium]